MLLPLLTRVSPHVALEVKGIVKALATTAAHVAACGAVALEVPCQHALQREGLGAERAAKHPRVPGSGDQSALRGLWEGHGSSDTHTHTHWSGVPRTRNHGGPGRPEAICVQMPSFLPHLP